MQLRLENYDRIARHLFSNGMTSTSRATPFGYGNRRRLRESETFLFREDARLSWLLGRHRVGPEFSPYVFPNMRNPERHLTQIRRSWAKALRSAGIPYFWLYNLRHTFASRLSVAGVSDLFVAQMIGHSSPSIVQTYAKAIDEHKRDAIRKLESLRQPQPVASPPESTRRPNYWCPFSR